MANTLQSDSSTDEATTITSEIWETAPSAEIMILMLWESKTLRQPNDITRYEAHLRLFAAACTRRVNRLLTDQRTRNAITTAERYAFGAAHRSELHQAHRHAETVVIELNHMYRGSSLPTTHTNSKPTNASSPTSVSTRTLFGAAVLHAASAASMACYAQPIFGGLQAAEACAKYSSKALYWEMLSNHQNSVLITEFLEEEDRRQAQGLRMFLGNPYNQERFPAMALPTNSQIASLNQ